MNDLEKIYSNYKPLSITKKKKVVILKTMQGDICIKKKNQTDYKKLYKYLDSRKFPYYPKIVSEDREDINIFEYQSDIKLDNNQKINDLVRILSLLHSKTTYFKNVTKDKYKEIYETIESNISYVQNTYTQKFDTYIYEKYYKPSHLLFLKNYSLINNACNYVKKELKEWLNIVENETKQRVSLVHNNLELDHYIKNEKEYIISWDNYIIDTPVIDLYKLYKKEWYYINFKYLIEIYEKEYKLLEQEKKLLYIMISMPWEIEENKNDYQNCIEYRKLINYLNKTSLYIDNQ